MTTCPDNSIACLLRALLEDNTTRLILSEVQNEAARFNWDPLNFALTAAIGVLALVVACTTVFQQLLAAGPGRIKASKNAIGPWSSKSASRFSFVELGLRTTAFTPHIDIDVDAREIDWIGHTNSASRRPLDPNILGFSASWANLLAKVGLDDCDLWLNQACKTDYLPADIQAAPATASLKSLAVLTVLTDDMSIIQASTENRIVYVRGSYSQLSARIHPVLGLVAAYESFDRPKSAPSEETWNSSSSRRKGLGDSIMLAHGYFVMGRRKLRPESMPLKEQYYWLVENTGKFLGPAKDHNDLPRAEALPLPVLLMVGEVPLRPRAFPKDLHGLKHTIVQLTRGSIWRWPSFVKLESIVAPDSAQILWDLAGRRQKLAHRLNSAFDEFRKRPNFTWFSPRADEAELQNLTEELGDKSNTLWLSEDTGVFCYTLTCAAHDHDDSDTESSQERVRYRQLRAEAYRDNARVMILTELFMTDLFLRGQSRLKVLCAVFVLLRTMAVANDTISHKTKSRVTTPVSTYASLNSDAASVMSMRSAPSMINLSGPDVYQYDNPFTFDIPEFAFRDGSFYKQVGDVYQATDSGPGCYPGEADRTEIGRLVAMVRFRALLFSALLDLCADTSCFFDGTVQDVIVKVL